MEPVSIVIITYNEEKNIKDCLDSVMQIEHPKKEVIVVDASNDNTPEIVKQYQEVNLITTENRGFASQRNIGVKAAKHDLIAFIDADCIVPKEWLNKLIAHMKEGVGGVAGNMFPPKDSPRLGLLISCLGFPGGGAIGLDANSKRVMDSIPTPGLFSKKAIENSGYFNEKLRYGGEDTELTKNIHKKGYRLAYEPDAVIYHKTRNTWSSFLKWSFRGGIAKYATKKNPLDVLRPLAILAFPFTRKYRLLIKRRKSIGVSLIEVLTAVNFLFLIRQIAISAGWIYGIGKSN